MTEDEVLEIARAGAAAGCTEALFTLGDKPELRYKVAREELARARLRDDARVPRALRAARARRDRPAAAPEPGRDDAATSSRRCGRSRPRWGSCSRRPRSGSRRAAARTGPRPTRLPARRLETIRLAGELAIPFTSGILIGIGETREERIDALLALKALGEEYGHVQEVIVQNFRAKPGTRMAVAPGAVARRPPLDDRGRAAPARPGLARAGAAEPRLRRLPAPARRRHRRLGRRLARDDRPCQPRGAVAGDRAAARGDARRAGSSSRRGCPSTPSTSPTRAGSIAAVAPARAPRRRRDAASRARTAGRRASRSTVPFVVRRDALPLELAGDELGEDELTRLFEARGARARARLRCRRPAAARGLRRRGQLRRHAEHPVHERLLLPLRLLRLLEGQARARTCAARPTSCRSTEIVRRCRGGVGARRDRGLPAGRDPSGASRATTTRRSSRRSRSAVPGHPRPRVLGARGLAGRGDARSLARRVPRAAARPRARLAARARPRRSSTTRCGPSSAPTR